MKSVAPIFRFKFCKPLNVLLACLLSVPSAIRPAFAADVPVLGIAGYWGSDFDKFQALIDANAAPGTLLIGSGPFQNDLQWYADESASGGSGVGPGQLQTRNSTWVTMLNNLHAKGYKVLNYIAVNGYHSGLGFDGHYSDMTVLKGKVDLAYSLYPELDGIFLDEAAMNDDQDSYEMRDYIKNRTGVRGTLVACNLASYQQTNNAQYYGDYLVLWECAWDSSSGFGGPYWSVTDKSNGDYPAQPDYVASWPKSKICAFVYGVPDVSGAAATGIARANERNCGNVYFSNRSAYFDRWGGGLPDEPLRSEMIAQTGGSGTPPPAAPQNLRLKQ